MKKNKILVLIVTFILVCSMSACNLVFVNVFNPDGFRPKYPEYGNYPTDTPHYSERVYIQPDEEKIQALYDEIILKSTDTSVSFDDLYALRNEFFNYYYEVITSVQVTQHTFYTDTTNTEIQDRLDYINNYYNVLNNDVYVLEQALFSSRHKDDLIEIFGQDYYDQIMGHQVKDEETLLIEEQIDTLTNEYNATPTTPGNIATLGDIYIDLVNLRNQLARRTLTSDGVTYYDNYLDYAYENVYGRSYTPDEINEFRSYVLEYYVPLSLYIYDNYDVSYTFDKGISADDIKEIMPVLIKKTIPQMINSWDYMINKGLYDFNNGENRYGGAFVSTLNAYGDGYMFIGNPNSLISSLNTVIHEFGHYNEIYAEDPDKANPAAITDNYDLAETHSQALELLSLPAITDYFNSNYGLVYTKSYAFNLLLNNVWSVLFNSAVDEFEYIVFNTDSEKLTTSFVSETFDACLRKYWKLGSSYSFYEVNHIFEVPAYCISYSVSAVFSAEIWSQEDAMDKYLDVVSYGKSNTLGYVCEQTGMPSPFKKETVKQIQEYYMDFIYNLFGWKR